MHGQPRDRHRFGGGPVSVFDRMSDFELYVLFIIVPLILWIVWGERKYRRDLRADAARRAIGQRYRPDEQVRRLG